MRRKSQHIPFSFVSSLIGLGLLIYQFKVDQRYQKDYEELGDLGGVVDLFVYNQNELYLLNFIQLLGLITAFIAFRREKWSYAFRALMINAIAIAKHFFF